MQLSTLSLHSTILFSPSKKSKFLTEYYYFLDGLLSFFLSLELNKAIASTNIIFIERNFATHNIAKVLEILINIFMIPQIFKSFHKDSCIWRNSLWLISIKVWQCSANSIINFWESYCLSQLLG